MNKMTFAAAVICFSFSHASYSEEMSATGWYTASSAVVSVGSSALVSGVYSPRTAAARPEHWICCRK